MLACDLADNQIAEAYGKQNAAEYHEKLDGEVAEFRTAANRDDTCNDKEKSGQRENAAAKQPVVETLAVGFARFLEGFGQFVGIEVTVLKGFEEDLSALFVPVHLIEKIGDYDSQRKNAANEDWN